MDKLAERGFPQQVFWGQVGAYFLDSQRDDTSLSIERPFDIVVLRASSLVDLSMGKSEIESG
jgi:hypothetical protein